MEIKNEELILITGGAFEFTSAMISALSKGVDTLFQLGRSIGTSIRMIISKRKC